MKAFCGSKVGNGSNGVNGGTAAMTAMGACQKQQQRGQWQGSNGGFLR